MKENLDPPQNKTTKYPYACVPNKHNKINMFSPTHNDWAKKWHIWLDRKINKDI